MPCPADHPSTSCRSLALNCLSLVWLPFGAVTTSLADIYNIFAKWNQYVREYENVTLQKPKRTEADTSQAQSGVAKPEMQGQGPLQDHLVPTQPGGSFSATAGAHIGAATCM